MPKSTQFNTQQRDNTVYGESLTAIMDELTKAEKKHSHWPEDLIHMVGIMTEECGEAMQAAIDCTYSSGDLEHLKLELAQTGAMALRSLIGINMLQSIGKL